MEERIAVLRRVPLFADVPEEVLGRLAQAADEREVPAGTELTHEGRHEGYFFVVVSGTVRIERGGRVVNTLGPGDFLGSIALVDAGPRTATSVAETDCRLLTITNEQFRELLDASPALRNAVLEAAEHNLRSIDDEAAT